MKYSGIIYDEDTTPTKWCVREKPCEDHLGNKYCSIRDMCLVYGISPETYTRRINVYHMTVEEALTRPVKHNGGIRCQDHNGKYYRSRTQMCKSYGIDRKLFEYRISNGWSLEDALTKPSRTLKAVQPE
ncbi:hypothetical protein [Butyrivibrio sp. INlla14]|uniref:hypothetical protein n=1 Tax=Butyrivibrio sp. INlla14 TaxID=1520808 RepID=UPI000876A02A|nr:hypothetical protein [Butyrivibrio sp. INlla14]SCY10850.1 hypothetical protein SAMN02910371_01092 [Butyrivibrio sp. INlla14]